MDSIRIAEVLLKICVIAGLKFKGDVPVFVETAFTLNGAYVGSNGNDLYTLTQMLRDMD